MQTKCMFIALFALLLAGACSPILKVYSEEEPGTNLYKYRTYDWLDNLETEKDNVPVLLGKGTEDKIRATVDERMSAYGFQRCDNGPDLMLHYHVILKDREYYYQDWWCSDEEWHKYGRCQRMRVVNYQEGTLIVDFIDAQTGSQVWRGVAISALNNIQPDDVNKRIEEAVREIFKKFPEQPRPGIVGR